MNIPIWFSSRCSLIKSIGVLDISRNRSNQDPSHRQPGEAQALELYSPAIMGEHQPTISGQGPSLSVSCLLRETLQPLSYSILIASDFCTFLERLWFLKLGLHFHKHKLNLIRVYYIYSMVIVINWFKKSFKWKLLGCHLVSTVLNHIKPY